MVNDTRLDYDYIGLPAGIVGIGVTVRVGTTQLDLPSACSSSQLDAHYDSPQQFLVPQTPFVPLAYVLRSH